MRNFEGVGSKNDFLITRHLSSGWVRRTRHQISAGADAPITPALTSSLLLSSGGQSARIELMGRLLLAGTSEDHRENSKIISSPGFLQLNLML